MNTLQKIKIKSGIFSLSLLIMGALAIAPSLANIANKFSEINTSIIQMLLAAPSLSSLIAALVVGKISTKISKKKLSLVGIILVGIGGLLPFFMYQYFELLLCCATIVGFGIGTLNTLIPSFIAENFSDQERGATFGQMTACVSIGAVVLTAIGGKLAELGWHYNYLVYLLVVPIFIIAFIAIPATATPAHSQDNATQMSAAAPSTTKIHINRNVVILAFFGAMFLLTFNAFPNNIALYLQVQHIGNVGTASLASSLLLFSGLLSGLLFGFISKHTKEKTLITSFIVLTIGLFITANSTNTFISLVGSFVSGFSLSIFMARAPFILSCIVEPQSLPMAIALYTAFTSIAGFISPFIINTSTKLFSSDYSPRNAILVGAIYAAIMLLILIISNFENRCLKKDNITQDIPTTSETI